MPVEIWELWNSRDSNQGWTTQSAVIECFIRGTDDDATARAAALAFLPLSFYGLWFKDVQVTPLGGVCWTVSANYDSQVTESFPGQSGPSPPPPPPPAPGPTDPLPPGFSMSVSSVQEKIYQSIITVSETRADGPTFPFTNNKAIGITPDGEVEGVDANRPVMEWSRTVTFPFIGRGFLNIIYNLVGTINDDVFYGFAAFEVLLVGVDANVKGTAGTEVTFKFQSSPNQEDIVISPDITVPFKGGHDYLWVSYEPKLDNVNKVKTMIPVAAYVETIYYSGDFTLLGIGA